MYIFLFKNQMYPQKNFIYEVEFHLFHSKMICPMKGHVISESFTDKAFLKNT